MPRDEAELPLDPALAATLADRVRQAAHDRLEALGRGSAGEAHLLELPLVLREAHLRQVHAELVVERAVGLDVARLRLGARLVDRGRDVGVGVAHDADRDQARVLLDGLGQLVEVARGEAQLGLDLVQARPHADPQLAVAGVGVELVGVATGAGAEVQHGLVAAALERFEHQHRVRLTIGAEAGEVRERRVRTEDVVGVVRAHLQAARGHDHALARVRGRHGGAALLGVSGDVGARWHLAGAGGPALGDERLERLGRRLGAVVGLLRLLLAAHPNHGALPVFMGDIPIPPARWSGEMSP